MNNVRCLQLDTYLDYIFSNLFWWGCDRSTEKEKKDKFDQAKKLNINKKTLKYKEGTNIDR